MLTIFGDRFLFFANCTLFCGVFQLDAKHNRTFVRISVSASITEVINETHVISSIGTQMSRNLLTIGTTV